MSGAHLSFILYSSLYLVRGSVITVRRLMITDTNVCVTLSRQVCHLMTSSSPLKTSNRFYILITFPTSSSVSRRGWRPVRSHRASHHLLGSLSWCLQGGKKRRRSAWYKRPTSRIWSPASASLASTTSSVAKKSTEGRGQGGKGDCQKRAARKAQGVTAATIPQTSGI